MKVPPSNVVEDTVNPYASSTVVCRPPRWMDTNFWR